MSLFKIRDYDTEAKERRTAHVVGKTAGVFLFLIAGIFTLSIADSYLLRGSSLASVISAVLVDLANSDRTVQKLGGLTVNPVLTAAAQAKADDMAAKSYFAHVSPEGLNSWHWFKQAGYTFLYAGENLAVDFSDSSDVEQAWMNSPTHRANILDGHFTEVGIATAEGTLEGHRTTFVVQMFGTPAQASAPLAQVKTLSSPKEATAPALATTKPVAGVAQASSSALALATVATGTQQVLGTEADSILPPAPASWWQHLLASPKTVLHYGYYVLTILLLVLIAFITELEFHKRHMRHVALCTMLFVLMIGLSVLADFVFFSTPVIAAFRAM